MEEVSALRQKGGREGGGRGWAIVPEEEEEGHRAEGERNRGQGAMWSPPRGLRGTFLASDPSTRRRSGRGVLVLSLWVGGWDSRRAQLHQRQHARVALAPEPAPQHLDPLLPLSRSSLCLRALRFVPPPGDLRSCPTGALYAMSCPDMDRVFCVQDPHSARPLGRNRRAAAPAFPEELLVESGLLQRQKGAGHEHGAHTGGHKWRAPGQSWCRCDSMGCCLVLMSRACCGARAGPGPAASLAGLEPAVGDGTDNVQRSLLVSSSGDSRVLRLKSWISGHKS